MGKKLLSLILLAAAMAAAAAEAQSLEGCPNKCGDTEIPYPFGVGVQPGTSNNCFLEPSFNLTCNSSTLFLGNIDISSISLQEGEMEISMYISKVCFNQSGKELEPVNDPYLTTADFTISSSANKFVSVGCDTYGYLTTSQNHRNSSTGCLSRCDDDTKSYLSTFQKNNSQTCSGIGCCQIDIPPGMRDISFQAYSFDNFTTVRGFNNCSYAFVAKHGSFNFSLSYLEKFPLNESKMVLDWSVSNVTCETASRGRTSDYACKANSDCVDSDSGYGYNCKCKPGFEGNPYHPNGCVDIDECKESKCKRNEICKNKNGTFECLCRDGYFNGTQGEGCQPHSSESLVTRVIIGVSASLVVLVICVSWLCLAYQKRKLIKQKHKFFHQNGGYILQQRLSIHEASSQTAKIFTAEELQKATNDYHDSSIIGTGGYGTVYKGFLVDKTVVAIKKSKVVHQNQAEQFINEVVILSQINHRNVVKLLGCCLETEVPLLVYEFINNGTLFHYIHHKSEASTVSWETRIRIAAEVAGALSYLHSGASIPIIHRDVKSSNILLDENYTAKVSDFGASKLVPLNHTEVVTIVQGTFGYLDPEYMRTNELTEKSDVYSFGVVLVELLTGKKAVSFDGPEEERCLAMRFLSSLKQGQLFDTLEVGIVNDDSKEMLKEVALLVERCLRLSGDERPSMMEVAMEIERIRKTWKHSWKNKEACLEEPRPLVGEISDVSECGGSINLNNTGWDSIGNEVLINLDGGR